MTVAIAPIIEGKGEKPAIGLVIRRIVADLNPPCSVEVLPASRYDRDKLLKEGWLEKAVRAGAISALARDADRAYVLVLLDNLHFTPADADKRRHECRRGNQEWLRHELHKHR